MDKLNKITAPAGEKFRQLQKIMHDIKNNERGIVQRFKNLTNKPPPTVPRRDYGPEPTEEEDWSDIESGSDYDNPEETEYVVPSDDADYTSYEPTPTEQPTFTTASHKFNNSNGGYVDKKSTLPNRPLPKPTDTVQKPPPPPPNAPNKALPSPFPKPRTQQFVLPPILKKPVMPQQQGQDDDDYINPDDDNYIDPNESPSPSPSPITQPYRPPVVNRASKPGQSPTARTPNRVEEPGLYEVPENEPKPSPPSRVAQLPRRNLAPKQEPQEAIEQSTESDRRTDFPKKPVPSPIPRNAKPKLVPPKQPRMPDVPPRDINSNIEKPQLVERQRIQSAGSEPLPLPPSRIIGPKIPIQKPPEPASRFIFNTCRNTVEQDAGVLHKEWYSPLCDRKAAEEALQASSKDGSFLVRKSTGQDSKQPFTLVVFYNRRVYNIPVRYIESTRQYALGKEKTGEEKFSSVAEMIENHQHTQLVLVDSLTNTKDYTKLEYPVRVR